MPTLHPEALSDPIAHSPFLMLNWEMLEQVATFIDFAAERLTIGFVSVNFAKDRQTLIEALRHHARTQEAELVELAFPDPNLHFLRDEILKVLPTIPRQPDKKRVLLITGLEQSIGMVGDYPPVLQDLNYVRDAFTHSVPHPLLVFLPDRALTRLARFAPDFWAWRMAVFTFKSLPETVDRAFQETLRSEQLRESLDLTARQERIDLLLRLLMEYDPKVQPDSLANRKTRIEILNELGVIYRELGDVQKAEDILQQALTIAENDQELDGIKASVLHALGIVKANQGEIEQAIALHQQSLALKESIGNVQGKAASLHCLASIYANQGQVEEAIALYKQSLALKESIGDVQGKAASLHCLAIIYANQGQVEEAIALHQQSLALYESIGNVQGKAASLHCLAIIYANQGQVEEAIDLFKQSLEIKERIGHAEGKAMTLWWLGDLAEQQGDAQSALSYLQAAVEILQRIKSPHAARLQETIDRLKADD